MKSKIKKSKIWLVSTLSFLMTAVLVLSGVGIYFHFSKDKGKGKPDPTVTVKPLDWATDVWDGKTVSALDFNSNYAGRGDYTKTINSAESFIHFINEVNSGKDFKDYKIYLNSHIDLNGHTINSIGSSDKPFKGTFEGSYYTIQNAKINGTALFEHTEDATIKNIGVYNCEITTSENIAAGLIRKAVNTNIENTFVRLGSITSALNVAGLVGEYVSNNGTHTIKNSFADTTLNAITAVGLIYSINTNNSSENEVTIENCYYTNTESAYSIVDNINFVDDDTNVVKATNINEFNTNGFDYHANYDNNKPWTNYTYKAGSKELSFTYPVLREYVKTFLTGSNYESVVVENGVARDASTLKQALDTTSDNVEVNIIVDEIYVDKQAEVLDTDVQINVMQDTTILRSEKNEESIFVASGISNLVIGNNGLTRSGETNTITIDGNRDYIEENNLESGALIVSNGNNVEIHNNVILKDNINTTTGYGGAVLLYNTDEQATVNAIISNCYAENGGGGICSVGTAPATLAGINNCSTNGNGGGALIVKELEDQQAVQTISNLYGTKHRVRPLGADLYQVTTITPDNWANWNLEEGEPYTYEGNSAGQGAGGVFFVDWGDLIIDFSGSNRLKFKNNTSANWSVPNNTAGGAIAVYGTINITNCDFEENTTIYDDEDRVGYGGAIFVYDIEASGLTNSFTNCTFKNNTAYTSGGAIYMQIFSSDGTGKVEIKDCVFENNKTTDTTNPSGYDDRYNLAGGAVCCANNGTTTITNSKFDGNESPNGGAIYMPHGDYEITGTEFNSNEAFDGYGGALYLNEGTYGSFNNCEFLSNHSTEYGGAICIKGGIESITDSSFVNNTADRNGSSISYNSADNLTLQIANTTFEEEYEYTSTSQELSSAIIHSLNGNVKIFGNTKFEIGYNLYERVRNYFYFANTSNILEFADASSIVMDCYYIYKPAVESKLSNAGIKICNNIVSDGKYCLDGYNKQIVFTHNVSYNSVNIYYDSFTFNNVTYGTKGYVTLVNNSKAYFKPSVISLEFEYDGLEKQVAEMHGDLITDGTLKATKVGDYNVTISLPNNNNYWYDGTKTAITLNWKIVKQKIEKPTLNITEFGYDGKSKGPTIVGFKSDTMTMSGTFEAIAAGTYYIKIKPKDGYIWADDESTSEITLTWKITDDPRASKPILAWSSFIYDGSTKTQQLYNFDENKVTYSGASLSNYKPGTYTITLSLKDPNNTWKDNTNNSITLTWSIKMPTGWEDAAVYLPSHFSYGGTIITGLSNSGKEALNGSNGKVFIPNVTTDGGTTVCSDITSSAFESNVNIKQVYIPNIIKSIGASAFKGCTSLTSITIPNSVTTIGSSAFENCTALTSVEISSNVTTINASTFCNCTALKTIKFGNSTATAGALVVPSKITFIGSSAFKGCKSLLTLNSGSLTTIEESAFEGCTGLTTARMPSVITIGNRAFNGCINLHDILFSNTSSTISTNLNRLTAIGEYAFEGCERIEDFSISSELATIGKGAFKDCILLRYALNFKNAELLTIIDEETFSGCKRLNNLELPTNLVEIKANAFFNCAFLGTNPKQDIIGITFPSSLTTIGEAAFKYTLRLGVVKNADNLKTIGAFAFQYSGIESIYGGALTSIGESAFHSCSSLTNVIDLEYSGVIVIENKAFDGCTSLVSNGDNGELLPKTLVKIGDYAFRYAYALEKIIFPSTLEIIGNSAFYHAKNLKSINSDENPITLNSIGANAFRACYSLISVNFSNLESGLEVNTGAFYSCVNLQNATLNNLTSMGSDVFYRCYALANVKLAGEFAEIPSQTFYYAGTTDMAIDLVNATNLESIGDRAFYHSGIKTLTMPSTLKSIGEEAFYAATNLTATTLTFNEGLTTLKDGAFKFCHGLNNIILPPNLIEVGKKVFYGCQNLKILYAPKDHVENYGKGDVEGAQDDYWVTRWPDGSENRYHLFNVITYSLTENKNEVIINKLIYKRGYQLTAGYELKSKIYDRFVTIIDESAFKYSNIIHTTIKLPETLREIRASAFEGVAYLTEITIPASVTTFGSTVFANCDNLLTVKFDNNSKITKLSNSLFSGCVNLTTINIPQTVTSIGNRTFRYTYDLTEVDLTNITEIGDYAFNLSAIKSINVAGSYEDYLYSSKILTIGAYAFEGCPNLEKFDFKAGLTIGEGAFKDCYNLTEVVMPAVESLGSRAFYGCVSLTNVRLGGPFTSIPYQAFYGAGNLMIVNTLWTENDFDGLFAGVTNLRTIGEEAFREASLADIILPDSIILDEVGVSAFLRVKMDTLSLSVNIIGKYAFAGSTLTTVELNYVQEMNYGAFNVCDNLHTVNISGTLSIIPERAFNNCVALTTVTYPNTIKTIGSYAFYGCISLTNFELYENLETIENSAFYNAKINNIKTIGGEEYTSAIAIPSTVISIGNSAFRSVGLDYVEFSGNSLTTIGSYAFENGEFEVIDLPSSVTKIGEGAFRNCRNLKEINLENVITIGGLAFIYTSIDDIKVERVQSIGGYAFAYCDELKEVVLPNSLTSIASYVFYGSDNLKVIYIPNDKLTYYPSGWNMKNSGVYYNAITYYHYESQVSGIYDKTTIAKHVSGTITLENFALIGEIYGRPVTTIHNNAFENSTNLISIILPNTVTAINSAAFSGCSNLISIQIPSNVTKLSNSTFASCYNLKYIQFGDALAEAGILNIPSNITEIGNNVFNGCYVITEAIINANITSMGTAVFSNCQALNKVTINSSLTSIPSQTFYNCVNLPSINIPSSVTEIGNEAFNNCILLEDITIPSNVTTIGVKAFYNCYNLTAVNFAENSNLTIIGNMAFYNCAGFVNIVLPNNNITFGTDIFDNCTSLVNIIAANRDKYLTYIAIGHNLAEYSDQLTYEVTLTYIYADGHTVVQDKLHKRSVNWIKNDNGLWEEGTYSLLPNTNVNYNWVYLEDTSVIVTLENLNAVYVAGVEENCTVIEIGENTKLIIKVCHNDCGDLLRNGIELAKSFALNYPYGSTITINGNLLTVTYKIGDTYTTTYKALQIGNNSFEGWYEEGSDIPLTTGFTLSGNKDVIAKFTEPTPGNKYYVKTYHLTYGDITHNETTADYFEITYNGQGKIATVNGDVLTIDGKTYTPTATTLDGKTFVFTGWYINNEKIINQALVQDVDIVARFAYGLTIQTIPSVNGDLSLSNGRITDTAFFELQNGDTLTVNDDELTFNGVTIKAVPTIASYTFLGWYNGEQKLGNGTITLTGTTLIFAKFDTDNYYNLTVQVKQDQQYAGDVQKNSDGWVKSFSTTYNQFIEVEIFGDYFTFDSNTAYQRALETDMYKYEFLGWYLGDIKLNAGENYQLEGNVVITAVYKQTQKTYQVIIQTCHNDCGDLSKNGTQIADQFTYSLNYGTVTNVNGTLLTIDGDSITAVPAEETNTAYYRFLGWFIAGTDTQITDSYTVTSAVTIEARFEKIDKLTVTIQTNDANYGDLSLNDTTADLYTYYVMPNTGITVNGAVLTISNDNITAVPTIENNGVSYRFLGWYIADTNTQITDSYTVTSTVIIEARFEKMLKITLTSNQTKGYISVKDAEGNSVMYTYNTSTQTFELINSSNTTFYIPADKQFTFYITHNLTNIEATNSYEILDIQFLNETITIYTPRDIASEIELGEATLTSPQTITLTYTSAYLMNIEIPSATVIGLKEFKTTSGRIIEYSNKYLIATGTKLSFNIDTQSTNANTYKYITITYTKDGESKTISVNSKTEDIKYVENVNGVYSYTIECDKISYITIKVEKLVIVTPNTDVSTLPEEEQDFVMSATFTSEDNLTEELDGEGEDLYLYIGRWYITTTTMTETQLENVLDNKYDVICVSEGIYYVDIQ